MAISGNCVWCGKTIDEHDDPRPEGSPVPRVPCLMLKSGFIPSQTKEQKQLTKTELNKMSLIMFYEAFSWNEQIYRPCIENMRKYGGGFVQALAECIQRADNENRYKIAEAFTEYCAKYSTWGTV